MFEYNGTQFSLEQVEEAALAKGLSVDEYVKEYGITKKDDTVEEVKTEAVVEDEIAPAAAKTVVTESQSDLGLLESQSNTVEEDFDIESIKFQFDKGNFEMDQRKAYEKYKSTGEIDESLLGEKTKIAVNEKGEKLGVGDAFKNAYDNMKPLVYSQIQNAKAYGYQLIEEFGQRGIENAGIGVGANVLDTTEQTKLKKEQAEQIDNAFDKDKIEAFNNAEDARKLLKTTGQGLVEGVKQGDLASVVGGAANGLANVITSAVPAMTAGVAGTIAGGPIAGTIASVGTIFGTQLAPQFYADFNIENAKALYPNLSENEAIAKLFKENKEQVATPTLLAAGASALETAGVKGLSRGIAGSLASKGAKNYAKAMLALGGRNGIISKAYKAAPGSTGAVMETFTELGQLPLELINQAEAKRLKGNEYKNYVWENFKDQAPEVAAQSFVGSRLFVAGGSQLRKAAKIIRDHAPVHTQGTASNSLFSLGVLKQRQALTKDPDVKQGMQDAINVVESQLKTELRRGNKLARKLSDKDIDTVIKANDEITNAQEQIENLEEQKEFGLDNTDYQMSRDGFQLKIKQADQKISEVLTRVADESTQNIRNEDGSFTEEYKNELEKIRLSIIKPATSKVTNQEKLNNDLIDLQAKLDEGLISENQYEADFTRLTSEYAAKNNDIKNKVFKVNESVESVKESSIQASKDLQQAFDDGVTEGTITKDKDGKNVISDKAFKAIIKTQKPFIKKLSNQVYNAIPQDLRRGTKAEYESNLETELLDVLRTYNRSIPLGAYVQGILRKRAVSARALEGISNQTFNKDLESNAVQSIIAEEDSEVAPEIKNINTAKALNISNNLLTTIKDVAKRALLTTQQKVDATKFKSDIAKTFKDALYTDIKQKLGLKDTKTNKGLTSAIETNPAAFYDAMSVEAMRKARGKGGINPFVEAGFLKDVNGVLEKVSLNKLGVDGILNYITDPNIAKNTRSDRQMHLVEALAVSMGAREAINLLEGDIEFRQRFAEQQQQEQQTEEFKKAADKIQTKSFFTKLIEKISILRDANSVAKLLNISESGTVTDKNRTKVIDNLIKLAENGYLSPNAILAWNLASVGRRYKSLDKNGTREYYLNDGTTSKPISKKNRIKFQKDNADLILPRPGGIFYAKTDPKFIQLELSAKENFKGKEIPKATKISLGTIKNIGKNGEITKAWKLEKAKQEAQNMEALEGAIKQLQKALAEGVSINDITPLIYAGYSTTSGIIKIAAPFKYVSKVFSYPLKNSGAKSQQYIGSKFREEHNPPASVVGATILASLQNGEVDGTILAIRNNYYQTQLSKSDDAKIDAAKLDATLPEGSSLFDNPIVRLAKSGIDLNSIINPLTGKTIAEENNVKSASTPDAVAASNAAAIANNSDQVENLIDRAIAKLTELTGTEGTLQTNLGAVPVNILIGGLRATKLAYQGGKALSDAIADGYKKVKDYMSAKEWSNFVSNSSQEVRNENNPAQVKLMIMNEAGVAKLQEQVRQGNYNILKQFGVDIDGLTTNEIIEKINILRKAKVVGSNDKAPKKKARVFDFDDTLAKTNSNVLYTLSDGTEGSLDATQFAEQYNELQEAGATFDYSEFNQVKDGSKGPLATLAKRFTEAKGDRDVFVLTARPAESAEAIQEFLRSTLGISIPLQNITGLANGKPGAKAMWVAEKVSEGYNDVFFADDVAANVKAVADMLDNLGVTKRVQQAKESGQRNLEDEMDSLIRGKKRSKIGKFLSRFNIYIPPGADDFAGLLKYFQAKGKLGDEQMKWFEENLLTPFAQGISAYTTAKVTLANDFKALNKRFKNTRTLGIPTKFRRMLSENVLGGIYTNEQAVRAYLYNKAGQDLGLNKADTQDLIALVEGNAELKAYAEELSKITKLDAGYPPITEQWLGGSISTDMAVVSNRAQRAEFLQEFTNNKNQIFSDQNMKLIKQIYGNDYTDALSNILERMETGQNRKKGKDKEFNSAMNWINQSVGAVMAINMRSAILQQMSIVNYMNWSFNNPIKMGLAMTNVPQFMKDYLRILNSNFLKERRGGMAIEVNLADIADSNPGNLFLRLNKKVLELGFKPTQWGDSNAIAFGGATWYRNRYNQLIKEGMSESEADAQAMLEFQEVSETAQQSSRVDKVSRQQASDIGRLILAFANTPLQYARETRKATSDLVNRRGDWKTNISKILYYGVAQNVIFTALQQGLFSLILSDADDEEYKETDKKLMYSLNSVADGILRGMGYAGAVVAALKNLSMEYYDQRQKREKGQRVYDGTLKLIKQGFSISPPISKKIGDIVEGQKFETWKQYKNDPFYQGFAYANYFSGLTNLPADRVFKKIENLKAASQDSTEAWQSVALALGWSPYNVGVDIEYKNSKASEPKKIKKLKSIKKPKSPVPDKLPEGVLGRANKDGTMDIKPGLSAKKRKEVVAHEQVHLDQFKSGKLDYTDSDITWKGQKIPRTADSKILYNGKLYIEGAKQLPWEKEANKLSKQKLS